MAIEINDYLFVLGRDIELGKAEVFVLLHSMNIEYKISFQKERILVLSIKNNVDTNYLINRLGGTVKIGRIISVNSNLEQDLRKIEIPDNKKIQFSLSVYNNSQLATRVKEIFGNILKDEHIKFTYKTFVNSESPKKLHKTGYGIIDLVVFSYYVALTISVSDPRAYKLLEERPENDFLKITSTRLAKILINLSGAKENQTLLDPFCGIGAILQNAMLIKLNVIGIDNDKQSVMQTRKNLEWTKKRFNLKNNFKIIEGDSRNINRHLEKNFVDIVVTEPYLGPYIRKTLSLKEARKLCNELESLYSKFFESLKYVIKDNSRVVFIAPRFKTKESKLCGLDMGRVFGKLYRQIEIPHLNKNSITFYGINKKIIREIYIIVSNYS